VEGWNYKREKIFFLKKVLTTVKNSLFCGFIV